MKDLINEVTGEYVLDGNVTLTQQQLHDLLKYFASRVITRQSMQITELLSKQISDDITT